MYEPATLERFLDSPGTHCDMKVCVCACVRAGMAVWVGMARDSPRRFVRLGMV